MTDDREREESGKQPVNIDAGLSKHQEPEIHVERSLVKSSYGVVDQHSSVGEPQQCEYCHHNDQHLDNLVENIGIKDLCR